MATLHPVGPDFYDTAPWKIDVVRELAVSPVDAWRVIADNERWPEWFPGATSCTTTSEARGGIGSMRHLKGRGLDVVERFIVWEEPAVWGFTILEMKRSFASRMAERATITDIGGGRTRVVYRLAIEPKPWARWMRPLIAFGSDKTVGKGLENIERQARS